MATDWSVILTDKANYPDTVEFPAPDGTKIPLGQIREAWISREKLLDAKAGEQAANARAIDAARQEAAGVYTQLQAKSEELAAREAAIAAVGAQNKTYDDNYLDPVKEQVATLQAALKDAQVQIKQALDNQKDMATRYMTKDWEHAMAEIGDKLPEGIDEKYLLKFAVDNGIKDRAGLPDIRRAFNVVTEPARRKSEIEAAEKRGEQRMKESILAGKLGKPAAMRIPPAGKNTGKQFESMTDAIAEGAAHDPEILRVFSEEMGGEV